MIAQDWFYTGVIVSQDNWEIHVTHGLTSRPLPLRLDLYNHSPTGFSWGYGGSGPAQAALAILADATGDDKLAVQLHQPFKWRYIARFAMDKDWQMNGETIIDWIKEQKGNTL